jgi:predicted nucleic acid-binding protein
VYVDTAYIAKYYLNEPESVAVRGLIGSADMVYSSVWALPELHCVFHRHLREGAITARAARDLARLFLNHVDEGLWNLLPAGEQLLRRAGAIVISGSQGIFLRTADAVHLTTAKDLGEGEVWTNDRHMLAAASHFGLMGRSVQAG